MKSRKAGQGTRRAAQSAERRAPRRATDTPEPQVTGLSRGGEIRLSQLLRALTGLPSRIKPVH
jgi:hypothetical protein